MPLDFQSAAWAPPSAFVEPVGRTGSLRPSPRRDSVAESGSLIDYAQEIKNPLVDWKRPYGRSKMASEITERLHSLRMEAQLEGIPFSEASLADFETFMRNTYPRVAPTIFLNDNGNVRAVWSNEQREQIALEFFGDREVQFVIFVRRPIEARMSRAAGNVRLEEIPSYVRASNVQHLLLNA